MKIKKADVKDILAATFPSYTGKKFSGYLWDGKPKTCSWYA